ncbi:MAG: NAD-dependent epimerase/dehydratase family protein [Streptomycetales bacterium]
MNEHPRVAVLGSGGFVGSAVAGALRRADIEPYGVKAPRLATVARSVPALLAAARVVPAELVDQLRGADVVVNAAGDPDASATDVDRLVGANSLAPALCLAAATAAGVSRFVHVSSAVVQGKKGLLDESERRDPFSPYALSKCLGEEVLAATGTPVEVVVYRPASVHAADRRVTRRISAIARSPLRSVASPGDQPSPQALVENVGAAVAFLCEVERPARYVIHPWEGLTTASLMTLLGGGRTPRRVPAPLARLLVGAARATVGRMPGRSADVRRVEMLWFGQRQAESWLTRQGWSPPVGPEGWQRLAGQVLEVAR